MNLAAKAPWQQKIDSLAGLRIWLVRQWFNVTCHFEGRRSLPRQVGLVIEPYKQLEKIAISRASNGSRVQRSAFALIAVGQGDERRFLLQWNANWRMFNLVGGKIDNTKGDADSCRRTIERELEEELGLKAPYDFSIVRKLKKIEMRQFSRRERIVKDYCFAVFEVDIFPGLPLNREHPSYYARWLSTGRENIFASATEIKNLCTTSGRPISATTRTVLQELAEI